MSSIINGPVLGTAGVVKFEGNFSTAGRAACTTLNVVGWIPCASIVSGAVRSIVGLHLLSKSGSPSKKALARTWIARGISEMCGLGLLLAPIDIGCTAARCIRCREAQQLLNYPAPSKLLSKGFRGKMAAPLLDFEADLRNRNDPNAKSMVEESSFKDARKNKRGLLDKESTKS